MKLFLFLRAVFDQRRSQHRWAKAVETRRTTQRQLTLEHVLLFVAPPGPAPLSWSAGATPSPLLVEQTIKLALTVTIQGETFGACLYFE